MTYDPARHIIIHQGVTKVTALTADYEIRRIHDALGPVRWVHPLELIELPANVHSPLWDQTQPQWIVSGVYEP